MKMVLRFTSYWICTLTFTLTLGLGDREFGEPCEPIKKIDLLEQYDAYGNPQQRYPSYTERSHGYGHGADRDRPYSGDQYTGQVNYPRGQTNYYPPPRHQNQIPSDLESRYAQLAREINETRRCRSELGLRCDAYTRTCKCFEIAGAAWQYERNRCEFTQIGTFCSPKITEFAQYCTEYAQCTCNWEHWDRRRWFPCDTPPVMDYHAFPGAHEHDTNNGRCLCDPGYRAHKDNSGCWYSSARRIYRKSLGTLIFIQILLHMVHKIRS